MSDVLLNIYRPVLQYRGEYLLLSEQITDMSDQNQFCSDTTATHALHIFRLILSTASCMDQTNK